MFISLKLRNNSTRIHDEWFGHQLKFSHWVPFAQDDAYCWYHKINVHAIFHSRISGAISQRNQLIVGNTRAEKGKCHLLDCFSSKIFTTTQTIYQRTTIGRCIVPDDSIEFIQTLLLWDFFFEAERNLTVKWQSNRAKWYQTLWEEHDCHFVCVDMFKFNFEWIPRIYPTEYKFAK